MKRLFCLLLAVLCFLGAHAAEPVELAPGLRYLRIHSLVQSAAELSAALNVNQSPALVVDLRYVADEKDAAEVLSTLNSDSAKPTLYILVSPETPRDVAAAVTRIPTPLVTLGVHDCQPAAEVEVEQSAENDRNAFTALDNGTSLAVLISGKIDKERFDEAELVKEFKNGNHGAHPPEGNADATYTSSCLTDRVLQRALHLHQALQALKGS